MYEQLFIVHLFIHEQITRYKRFETSKTRVLRIIYLHFLMYNTLKHQFYDHLLFYFSPKARSMCFLNLQTCYYWRIIKMKLIRCAVEFNFLLMESKIFIELISRKKKGRVCKI